MNGFDFFGLIKDHPYAAVIATWLLGNAVAALPTPNDTSPGIYKFFFNFATFVGSAIPRSIPQLRIPPKDQPALPDVPPPAKAKE